MDRKNNKKKLKLSYRQRKSLYGYGFLSLWLVGTLVFFIIPVIKSFIYSFKNVDPQVGGLSGSWVGLKNYTQVFSKDPYYRQYLFQVLSETIVSTPLILIFSLFAAVMLNQKFKGRAFVRAIFFLPVIVASGPVYAVITGGLSKSGAGTAEQFSTLFKTDMVTDILEFTGIYGLSSSLTTMIQSTIDSIFSLIWRSGIQILVFLAALQNIPPSAKEAALMEGATSWEYFWKITFPYVTPMIAANLIFTVIDSFTDSGNVVMARVIAMQDEWRYGMAAAMVWSYFAVVMIIVGLLLLLIKKKIYYEV